jgi:Flp pilus assembly protein TadG
MNILVSLKRFPIKKQSIVSRTQGLLRSEDEGQAIVETAVTLPLILLIMTGIFSFSIALYQKLMLSEAVGNAGRMLAVDRGSTNPCLDAANAIYAAAPTLKQSNITLTFTLDGTNYGAGVATCPGPSGGKNTEMVQGQTAVIQATYPTAIGVYGMNVLNSTLGTQITEVIQ